MMRVAIVHNAVEDADAPDQRDVLIQAEAVRDALLDLNHQVATIACSLDLSEVRYHIEKFAPEIIFNLVEDLAGHGRLIHLFPFLLDAMAVPYT